MNEIDSLQTLSKEVRTSQKEKMKPKKILCRICKKSFSTKGNLVQHMATHVILTDDDDSQNPPTFDCDRCGKPFLQKRYLIRHQLRCEVKKKAQKQNHRCALCGKIFNSISHLRRHESHHLRQKQYVCSLCDCGFVQQYHLERHFRSEKHLQKEIEAQQDLPAGVTINASEAAAIKYASNVYRHKCFFCRKAFSTAWEMQRHWRTMHPYAIRRTKSSGANQSTTKTTFLLKCLRCGARFDNDLLYKNHVEWHMGKRPYKCERCHFAFPRRLELENHTAAKHGVGWMFVCVECGQEVAQRTEIERHLKKFHPPPSQKLVTDNNGQNVVADNTISKGHPNGTTLLCKYCGMENRGVENHRDHIAAHHFFRRFVDRSAAATRHVLQVEKPVKKPNRVKSPQLNSVVQLAINIENGSAPVYVLRLGPTLPDWLLELQPSYAQLDMALDEGRPLVAGESIVLQLPLPTDIPVGSIKQKTIRISYSTDGNN